MSVHPVSGLTDDDLAAIAALEARVVAHDGGRLKLEWGRLRSRDGARPEDVLARDGDRLVGFAGLYGPGPASVEIAGMVDPDARGRGLGGELLDAARALCDQQGSPPPLLIVPRPSSAGVALALARGGTLEHSEHALLLAGEPTDGPSDPALSIRTARREDTPRLLALWTGGFGFAPADVGERLDEPGVRTLAIEREGAVVGTMRVSLVDGMGGVYGFVVDPALRGHGLGRDALRRACHELRARGAEQIGLEVEVDNDRALGLYTSLGFGPVTTEDYWRLADVGARR